MRAREMEISERRRCVGSTENPRTRGGSRRSKRRESVLDLEAEETKGFIDLGFVFTKEDLNSELTEILPGLRTFLHREEQNLSSLKILCIKTKEIQLRQKLSIEDQQLQQMQAAAVRIEDRDC